MVKIEKVVKNTGKTCSCGGAIVETFVKKYGKGNGVIGPGYRCSSWVESTGFGCNTCGRQYGEPVYKKTQPTPQIEFELSLYTARLLKKITNDELHPLEKLVPSGKTGFLDIGNQKVSFKKMEIKESKAKVPPELKVLSVGKTVFVPTVDTLELRGYTTIQLTKKRSAKTFHIKSSCLK